MQILLNRKVTGKPVEMTMRTMWAWAGLHTSEDQCGFDEQHEMSIFWIISSNIERPVGGRVGGWLVSDLIYCQQWF